MCLHNAIHTFHGREVERNGPLNECNAQNREDDSTQVLPLRHLAPEQWICGEILKLPLMIRHQLEPVVTLPSCAFYQRNVERIEVAEALEE